MPVARRFQVKGRVQGVFFRASTRRVAESLGITGYAINLSNGDVEVLACGESEAIDRLAAYLHEGPSRAEVTGVTDEPVAYEARESFTTG